MMMGRDSGGVVAGFSTGTEGVISVGPIGGRVTVISAALGLLGGRELPARGSLLSEGFLEDEWSEESSCVDTSSLASAGSAGEGALALWEFARSFGDEGESWGEPGCWSALSIAIAARGASLLLGWKAGFGDVPEGGKLGDGIATSCGGGDEDGRSRAWRIAFPRSTF